MLFREWGTISRNKSSARTRCCFGNEARFPETKATVCVSGNPCVIPETSNNHRFFQHSTNQATQPGVKLMPHHILIVDDSPTDIETMKKILGSQGYKTSAALGGEEVIKPLARLPKQLIRKPFRWLWYLPRIRILTELGQRCKVPKNIWWSRLIQKNYWARLRST